MKKRLTLILGFLYLTYASVAAAQQGQTPRIQNPIRAQSISAFIADVLNAIVQIGIPICILAIIWVGFRYVKAQGKPDELKEVHAAFLYTVIGIAIFIGASIIAGVIQGTICDIGFTNLCGNSNTGTFRR
jgi:hypothetical protein